jgi:FkbM family methyltransferase
MFPRMKRLAGKGLLEIGDRFPAAKPFLKSWGLRADHEWFGQRPVRVQLPDGHSFRLASVGQNYLSFQLFWKGTQYYEPITTLLARELVQAGGTFMDIGANIGFYSLVLSTCRPGLKVIAFEPNPKNFRLLQQNVSLNGLESQIRCEPLALSDEDGSALLYLSASDMSASLESDFQPTGQTVTIRATRLDSYLADQPISGPLVIKVDVEGHETAFFKGAQLTLQSRKPDIISEVTRPQDEQIATLLKQSGYRFYKITDQGLLPSDELKLVVRGRLVFLNYLLSARPETEIAGLFERIRPRVAKLDLTQSSKFVDPAAIRELQAQQSPHQNRQPQSSRSEAVPAQ